MFRITFADQQWLDIKPIRQNGILDYRFHTSGNRHPYLPSLRDTAFFCSLLKGHSDTALPDVIDQIAKHDWCLAAAVALEIGYPLPAINDTIDEAEEVELSVWGGNCDILVELKIPMSVWIKVLAGRSYLMTDSYRAEGETFECAWHFDDGDLKVSGSEGNVVFNASLDCIGYADGWKFGPNALPQLLLTRKDELRARQEALKNEQEAEGLHREAYSRFLGRIDEIFKNSRHRRRVELDFSWRESLEIYKEKLGTPAPEWIRPLAPAQVVFPSMAIRVLLLAAKAQKTLPQSYYLPECACVPERDLNNGYLADYEKLQAKLRLTPQLVTVEDLPVKTRETDIPAAAGRDIESWPLDPLYDEKGEIAGFWLPAVAKSVAGESKEEETPTVKPSTFCESFPADNGNEERFSAFAAAFRRGDREALRGLDPDGLMQFERKDTPWFRTSYGQEFLKRHAVSILTLNTKLLAIKPPKAEGAAVIALQDKVVEILNQERADALLSEDNYPTVDIENIWLELNALDRNRSDDALFWSFRLPEGPFLYVGNKFEKRYAIAALDDYALNVDNAVEAAVIEFKRLSRTADALSTRLSIRTTEGFLEALGVEFEVANPKNGYETRHRAIGWIPADEKKSIKKRASQTLRALKNEFSDVNRQDLLNRIAALYSETARLTGTRKERRETGRRILPNSERALERLLALSDKSDAKSKAPFIVGPFISNGRDVVVATHVCGVAIPPGFYRALLSRIPEAIPVKLDRMTHTASEPDPVLEIPKNRRDWDRCWLVTEDTIVKHEFRVTVDFDEGTELVRLVLQAALEGEPQAKIRYREE